MPVQASAREVGAKEACKATKAPSPKMIVVVESNLLIEWILPVKSRKNIGLAFYERVGLISHESIYLYVLANKSADQYRLSPSSC